MIQESSTISTNTYELTNFGDGEYLICMPPSKIYHAWADVRALLLKDPSLLADDLYPEDLLEKCNSFDYQLWVYVINKKVSACVFSEILLHSTRKKSVVLHFAAGQNRDHWLNKSYPIVKEWAKLHGCTEISFQGRKGWSKTLGIKYDKVIYQERLENGWRK